VKSVTILLGEQSYTIHELPTRKNEAWRKKLSEPFARVAGFLENGPQKELNDTAGIGALVREVSELLIKSPEIVTGLLFDYAPELAADRERISENCYDSEIMDAFVEVLKLAFPFGGLIQRVAALGSASKPTKLS